MTGDIGLDYLRGDNPVGIDLQIADGAVEQRGTCGDNVPY